MYIGHDSIKTIPAYTESEQAKIKLTLSPATLTIDNFDMVYQPTKKALKIPILLGVGKEEKQETALLDSGATENFIHPRLVKQ